MSGNAIYYGLVAIFFAQVYNIDLSMGAWAAIIVTSTLGAIGQAGVPGPSFLVVAVLLAVLARRQAKPALAGTEEVALVTKAQQAGHQAEHQHYRQVGGKK